MLVLSSVVLGSGGGCFTMVVGWATILESMKSSSKYATFNLSMLTESFLLLTPRIKYLSLRSMILKGPLYGGSKGLHTLSTLTHTWLQFSKCMVAPGDA